MLLFTESYTVTRCDRQTHFPGAAWLLPRVSAVGVALLGKEGQREVFWFWTELLFLVIIECSVVEHLVVKVSLYYFLGKQSSFQGACGFSVPSHLPPSDFCL